MAEFPTFKGLWPWPWIGSYCIPSCITHRPLATYQISLKSKKLFVDGRADGHLRPTLLARLRRVDLTSSNDLADIIISIMKDRIDNNAITCDWPSWRCVNRLRRRHLQSAPSDAQLQLSWTRYRNGCQ